MQVPLHYQVSEYDSAPTAMLNAIIHLFDRRAVPPPVVRHIYTFSLDAVGGDARVGIAGTSDYAIQLLGHWLGSYKTRKFSVSTEYLTGDQVHLGPGNRLVGCLNAGGVVICDILLSGAEEHIVLATGSDSECIYFFDSYKRTSVRGMAGNVRVLASPDGRAPNLAIRREWLDADTHQRRFCFGLRSKRQCLLMVRER